MKNTSSKLKLSLFAVQCWRRKNVSKTQLVFVRCFHTNEQQPCQTLWLSLIDNCLHCVLQFLRSFHHKIYGRHYQKGPGTKTKFNKNLKKYLFKVLDTLRTLVIWIATMLLHFTDERWDMPSFKNQFWLQLAGFVFVVTGIFLYSDVLIMPAIRKRRKQSN